MVPAVRWEGVGVSDMAPTSAPALDREDDDEGIPKPRAALGYVPSWRRPQPVHDVDPARSRTRPAPTVCRSSSSARRARPVISPSAEPVTAHFLDHTDAEWLWWADADMGFEPDTLSRLIDAADRTRVRSSARCASGSARPRRIRR